VRIVLDNNVIVSGIFWKGVPSEILECWINKKFQLLTTEPIIEEYEKTLTRISKGKNERLVTSWIMFIIENGIVVNVRKKFQLSSDPDDDKFIDCAVSGNADLIVSGDSHLLDLKSVLDINIVKPKVFISILR